MCTCIVRSAIGHSSELLGPCDQEVDSHTCGRTCSVALRLRHTDACLRKIYREKEKRRQEGTGERVVGEGRERHQTML